MNATLLRNKKKIFTNEDKLHLTKCLINFFFLNIIIVIMGILKLFVQVSLSFLSKTRYSNFQCIRYEKLFYINFYFFIFLSLIIINRKLNLLIKSWFYNKVKVDYMSLTYLPSFSIFYYFYFFSKKKNFFKYVGSYWTFLKRVEYLRSIF